MGQDNLPLPMYLRLLAAVLHVPQLSDRRNNEKDLPVVPAVIAVPAAQVCQLGQLVRLVLLQCHHRWLLKFKVQVALLYYIH